MDTTFNLEYRNAHFIHNGWIDCEINHPTYGWIPFTCNPDDKGAQFDTKVFFDGMVANGDVAPYIPPSEEELRQRATTAVRAERDNILASVVDPIATNPLRWGELSDAQKQAWADYRHALLDIPQQEGFPYTVTWPSVPE